jgi:iron complex outermembrane recepter protein
VLKANGLRVRQAVAAIIATAGVFSAAYVHAASPAETSLETALGELAARSGLQLIYRTEATRGLRAKPMPTGLSPEEELRALLDGTGLQIEKINERTITIRRAAGARAGRIDSGMSSLKLASAEQTTQGAGASVQSVTTSDEDEAAQPGRITDELFEVVVTASRVSTNASQAPTPTTAISVEEFRNSGLTNVADLLNTQIPSFRASVTPTASTLRVAGGGNFLDLRGLDPARTLVLVDGRRHVPSGDIGSVNLNVIPQALIERVEVVTGGASAAWGSDAVAGVVNLIFKKNFEGFEGDYRYGQSSQGDAVENRASLLYGTRFGEGRGEFLIASEWVKNEGILDQSARDWGRKDWQVIGNPDYEPGNGLPARLVLPNVHVGLAAPGGLIIGPDELSGIQFGPGGALMPFHPGTVVSGLAQQGGSGINPGRFNTLQIPETRATVFSRARYELTDTVGIFAELSYAESRNRQQPLATFDFGSITIDRENPFIPDALAQRMDQLGVTELSLGRLNNDFGFLDVENLDQTERAVLGLEGSIGEWSWDTYYQFGRSSGTRLMHNNRIQSHFRRSVDAVIDPRTGSAICRSTLTSPNDGCVPVNLFGEGSPSAEALGYFMATSRLDSSVTQNVVAANLRGEPFSTWAAPVAVAFGAEYRDEKIDVDTDEIQAAGDFQFRNEPLHGKINVREAYAEAIVPILRDVPFAQSFDLNGAVRYTEYNTSGSVATWKVGAVFEPLHGLRLRATQSRDIRAPGASELFSGVGRNLKTVIDPLTGDQRLIDVYVGGNPELQEESADTKTFGIVVAPTWMPGFEASVDYYDVEVSDAIDTLDAQAILDRCDAGASSLCSLIVRDPGTQVLTSVTASYINVSRFKTSGVDLDIGYRLPLSSVSEDWSGTLIFRVLANHVDELISSDGVVATDTAGSLGPKMGGVPKWRWTASTTYEVGAATWYLGARYVGGGKYDRNAGPEDINDNNVDSRLYFDTSIRYELLSSTKSTLSLFGSVRNLLDKDPPIAPTPDFVATPTNTVFYDVIGRYFSVGLRYGF